MTKQVKQDLHPVGTLVDTTKLPWIPPQMTEVDAVALTQAGAGTIGDTDTNELS